MALREVLVWDAPTRVFHWALALSFVGAFLAAGSERYRDIHVALGVTAVGLIAFRLVWGVGSRYARFSAFAFGPRAVLAYLKSVIALRPQRFVGHNPAGSLMIYGLLLLGALAGLTGYATYIDLGGGGAEELHEGLANAMLAVVLVHIGGVIVSSLLHRENLVAAMVTGRKSGAPGEGIVGARWWVAALLIVGVAIAWTAVVPLTPGDTGARAATRSLVHRAADHERDH